MNRRSTPYLFPLFSLGAAAILAGNTFASSALENSALLFYSFDAGGGVNGQAPVRSEGKAPGLNGIPLNGTLYGGAAYAEEKEGFSLAFDGKKSFVRCGRTNLSVFSGDFSLLFWIRMENLVTGGVMGKKGEAPEAMGWILETTKGGSLLWKVSDGTTTAAMEVPVDLPEAWNQIALVRSGDTVVAYVNGQEVARQQSPVFAEDLSAPDAFFNLGRLIGNHRSFSGRLDRVGVYDRALDVAEVTQNYASTQSEMMEAHDVARREDALLVHYRFERDPEGVARDLSGNGHDGVIANAEFLPEVDGQKGVLRFDGNHASLDLGNPPGLQFSGDLSFEMRVRLNRPLNQKEDFHGYIFGEYPINRLRFGWTYFDNLLSGYGTQREANMVPLRKAMIGEKWAHVVMVYEYPRARAYLNGELVQDQVMLRRPTEKLTAPKFLGGEPQGKGKRAKPPENLNNAPVDLAEFRLYRRALAPDEVKALALGQEASATLSQELAVEPDWYKGTVTIRLISKGRQLNGKTATLALKTPGREPLHLEEETFRDVSGNGSQRYEAVWTVPAEDWKNREATFEGGIGTEPLAAKTVKLSVPEWIAKPAGVEETVPPPWTPLKVEREKGVAVEVSGRRYQFENSIFPVTIRAKDQELLSAPITLHAISDGRDVIWQASALQVGETTEVASTLSQTLEGGKLTVTVTGRMEYDGYLVFDCEVKAKDAVDLDGLCLKIPLQARHAGLCAASYVYKPKGKISMSESYWDAIRGDIDFHFGPSVWIGDEERGLTWQSESAVNWHNRDPEKALQIRPEGETTHLLANFVDKGKRLSAGESLTYRFALLATPVKPMVRNAWDLRVMRSGPSGRELDLPNRTFDGKPQLQYLADLGVRNLYWWVSSTNWPWPLPENEELGEQIRNLNKAGQAAGLKLNPYAIHIRYPLGVEAFDQYGAQIVQHPIKVAAWGSRVPVNMELPRPGPFARIGDTQLCVQFCPKSTAAQDSYVYSLAERQANYGDNGVYLDGTAQVMPCTNQEHGCGYIDEEGNLQPTYPVFASRDFIRRIYRTIKAHDPQGIVDLHYWLPNPAQAAYSDINFTGEQWHQLRFTGADHVSDELTLERFRSMFMGYQVGTPTDLMSYRLGSTRRVAAISLLHDVPVRLNQGGRGLEELLEKETWEGSAAAIQRIKEDADYFRLLPRIWKLRDEFEINEAKAFFYWNNASHVTVTPERAHATFFAHPENGLLALVSNLEREKREVHVRFNLGKLGLTGQELEAVNALNGELHPITADGVVKLPIESEDWLYLWVRPAGSGKPRTASHP